MREVRRCQCCLTQLRRPAGFLGDWGVCHDCLRFKRHFLPVSDENKAAVLNQLGADIHSLHMLVYSSICECAYIEGVTDHPLDEPPKGWPWHTNQARKRAPRRRHR